MKTLSCNSCLHKKAQLHCHLCELPICKDCAFFIDEESFYYQIPAPIDVHQTTFCSQCFDSSVSPLLQTYKNTLEKAKNVQVFSKSQSKETRTFSRKEPSITVIDGKDEEDITLKLAFLAAMNGFNSLIDLEMSFKKVKQGSYQYLNWTGTARPTRLSKDFTAN